MSAKKIITISLILATFLLSVSVVSVIAKENSQEPVQLGPRPFFLLDKLEKGKLKKELQSCKHKKTFERSAFVVGHRGAPLQFPELTVEGYKAAVRMGSGMAEWDVVFTKDKKLVVRHGFEDLAHTTNILEFPELRKKCSVPFTPAQFNENGELVESASAVCRTTDITLEELKKLNGVMAGANPRATEPEEYYKGTGNERTDIYSTGATLVTHSEMIELASELGIKMNPELKPVPDYIDMPYQGDYSREDFAQDFIDAFKEANVDPDNVLPISFDLDNVMYWINNDPRFGRDAGWLDGRYPENPDDPSTWSPSMKELFDRGLRTISPPMWMLLSVNNEGEIVPSEYAKRAKEAGLNITTWTLERSGRISMDGGWYYQTFDEAIETEGDVYKVLDVLAQDVGVMAIANDWPATLTYYANCKDVETY